MLKVSFKSYPDNLDILIKNKMRENYASLENEVVKKATADVNENFRPRFNRQIAKIQNEIGKNDLVNILSEMSKAYKNAGLENDAKVLESHTNKINLEA